MKRTLFGRKTGVTALAAVAALAAGSVPGLARQRDEARREIPRIDRELPSRTETATFALG